MLMEIDGELRRQHGMAYACKSAGFPNELEISGQLSNLGLTMLLALVPIYKKGAAAPFLKWQADKPVPKAISLWSSIYCRSAFP